MQRGRKEKGIPHGDEGNGGQTWGDEGNGSGGGWRWQLRGWGDRFWRGNRGGDFEGRLGHWGGGERGFFPQLSFQFLDQFDDGFGGALAVLDVSDVLAADAHLNGEFWAGDTELVADGFDPHGEGELSRR
jgi:hypothetical protein